MKCIVYCHAWRPGGSSRSSRSWETTSGSTFEVVANSGTSDLTVASGFTNNGALTLSNANLNYTQEMRVTSGTLVNAGTIVAEGASGQTPLSIISHAELITIQSNGDFSFDPNGEFEHLANNWFQGQSGEFVELVFSIADGNGGSTVVPIPAEPMPPEHAPTIITSPPRVRLP